MSGGPTVLTRGRTALVTGASSGIGQEFARRLAAAGLDLAIVSRRAERLEALAQELHAMHGVEVSCYSRDLADPDAVDALVEDVEKAGLEIDVLVNSAGLGVYGSPAQGRPVDADRSSRMLQVNVVALARLSDHFLGGMCSRGRGALINIASTAGFQPVPFMAAYGASKAFVLSYTEALWAETRGTGVRVLALCPGTTRTEFSDLVGVDEVHVGHEQTPQEVVQTALRHLRRSSGPSVVSGWQNAVQSRLPARVLSRSALARVVHATMKPRR